MVLWSQEKTVIVVARKVVVIMRAVTLHLAPTSLVQYAMTVMRIAAGIVNSLLMVPSAVRALVIAIRRRFARAILPLAPKILQHRTEKAAVMACTAQMDNVLAVMSSASQ